MSVFPSAYLQTLIDGWNVLRIYFPTWLIYLLAVALCSIAIKLIFLNSESTLSDIDVISLGVSGSPIILTISGILIVLLQWTPVIITGCLAFFLAIILSQKNRINSCINPHFITLFFINFRIKLIKYFFKTLLIIIVINLFFVKFGYINGLELPLNIDSVNHTYLSTIVASTDNPEDLTYYHYAFHYVVVALHLLTGISLPITILLFGQLLQVIIPLTIYYPVHKITKNSEAALISVLVVGFGWSMPSQATSWGKYPAIMGMVCLIFVFHVTYQYLTQNMKRQYIFVILTLITSIFIHSRIFVLLIIGFLSISLAKLVGIQNKYKTQYVLICLLLLILLSQIIDFESLKLALYPYMDQPILLLALIVLTPFSLYYFPGFTLNCALFIAITLIFNSTPLGNLNFYNTKFLIDRPFLSIFLFIPLTIILGAGLAGMEKFFKDYLGQPQISHISMIFLIIVIMVIPNKKIMEPQTNAHLVTTDDHLLYRKIEEDLPISSRILVPNAHPIWDLGIDGGAWIGLITNLKTIKFNFDLDLSSPTTLREICTSGVQYIYVGNKPYSFSLSEIELREHWYRPIINYPDAKLYQIVACPQS